MFAPGFRPSRRPGGVGVGGGGGGAGLAWDAARNAANLTYSNGNKSVTGNSGSFYNTLGLPAIGAAAKVYLEFIATTVPAESDWPCIGCAQSTIGAQAAAGTAGVHIYLLSRGWYWTGSGYATGKPIFASGQRGMLAIDRAAGKLWFGKLGTWNDSGDPALGTNAPITTLANTIHVYGGVTSAAALTLVPAQSDWLYTPPLGFAAP